MFITQRVFFNHFKNCKSTSTSTVTSKFLSGISLNQPYSSSSSSYTTTIPTSSTSISSLTWGAGKTIIFSNFNKQKNYNNNNRFINMIPSNRNMSTSSQQPQSNESIVDPNKGNENKSFLYRYLNNTYEHHPTWSKSWIMEKSYQMVIFAITGSSALHVVRYLLKNLWHVEGTVFGGPWQFTVAYFVTMFTCYPFVLLFWGTLFGRHQFFKKFFLRMTIGFPQRIIKLLQKKKQQ